MGEKKEAQELHVEYLINDVIHLAAKILHLRVHEPLSFSCSFSFYLCISQGGVVNTVGLQ